MANERIAAVIVLFNSSIELLRAQHNSLVLQASDLIYVDNGSAYDSPIFGFLSELSKKPNHHIIYNYENMGLGFAQNQGIRLAINLKANHILLLDHDSILRDKFLFALLQHEKELLANNINVGAVGATYFNEATGEIYPITKYHGPFISRIIPSNEPVSATFLIASGTLISVEVLNDVGFMNVDLFVDYIDVDWCARAKSKGYELFAIPDAKMNHIIGDRRVSLFGRKISVHSTLRRYYLTRNCFYMLRHRQVPIGYKIRETVFNFLRIFIFFFLADNKKEYILYTKKALLDGFRGNYGKINF